MIRNIRVVIDPPREQFGVINPDPTDYLDFNVEFTSKFQYDFFYDLVKDRVALIDKWEDGRPQGGTEMDTKFELHDVLKDASLETVCDLASRLERICQDLNPEVRDMTEDLSLALEYLRLHFKLVPIHAP